MDSLVLIVAVVVLAGLGFILFRLTRLAVPVSDPHMQNMLVTLGTAQAELAGRLAQISDRAGSAQAELARSLNERLDALGAKLQESQNASQTNLAMALNERLDAMGKRVGDSLIESTEKTSQTMTDLQKRLVLIDEAQRNLTDLSSQVVSLQDILSNKQARGAFGEVQLGDMVRDMLPPAAYQLQAQLSNGKRADCLINLPNPPGSIAVDSKFPLEAYRALREARDDAARVLAARAFVTDVRKHVDDISARYIVPGETAEMAIMFLPSEAVYAELHANFPQVVEYGHKGRVFIVSPSTMWATLHTMRAILKDVRMREQAGVIQKEVMEIFEDVNRLRTRTANLRKHFGNVESDVRDIEISADKIIRRADRIREVQISDDDAAPDELPIGSATGNVTARTLMAD
ncbi:MAG: DNA recombination protein RmuC [Alphaproteobacteria bacterium]|nr:DNA recombination protein RmuC [Alphaproteobacteria bacterium]